MKNFFKILTIFICFLYILMYFLDFAVSKGLQKSGLRKYVSWDDIYEGKIDSDVIILGSSRAWSGYNTYTIDSILQCNSYNLGIDGHKFGMQEIKYNTYKRFSPKPKLIILNYDIMSLGTTLTNDKYEREQFFPFIQDDILIDSIKESKDITILERYLPFFRYYGYKQEILDGIKSICGKKNFADADLYKGFRSNNRVYKDKKIDLNSIILDTILIAKIENFIKKTIAEKIRIVIVKAPYMTTIINNTTKYNELNEVIDAIAHEHSIPIIDYAICDISHDSTYFYNPTHLNTKGANEFTQRLATEIKKLGLY